MTDIRRKQAQLHIKFSNLRNGIIAEGSDRKVAALLDPTRLQPWRQRPPRLAWPRHPGFVYPPRGATVAEAVQLHDEKILYSALSQRITLDSETKRQGRKTMNQAARHLSKQGFRYYRTLGWGGEGLATLFYVTDATGRWRRIVAKMALSPTVNFMNERIMSLQFRGRDHILQRQLGADLAEGDKQAPMDTALRAAESRMILFEFAEFGSLASLLKKASDPVTTANDPLGLRADRGRPLPDRVLLHILQCLATACNDLCNPLNVDRDGNPVPDNGPVVHFDFEPSNLLFGGAETVAQPEHTLMPILKVSDFGLASSIPSKLDENDAINRIWGLRRMAKSLYFLPEQFSQDWDYVTTHPFEDNIDTYGQVAGRYGPASNIYHVGLTLWSCITGAMPQAPTHARLVVNPVPRVDGAVWFTWFAEILDDSKYGIVDRELRQTVLACLAEEPRQRIDSRALLDWCNGKINRLRQAVGSTDAELYAWAAANMSAPPEPTNQTPMPDFDPHDPSDKQFNPFDQEWQL